MTVTEFLSTFAQIAALLFVVTSMLAMGMSLTMSQIFEPLKNARLVILALLLFIIGSLLIGLLLGGRDPGVRSGMGLGTGMRNISAAIVVAAQNFSAGNTLSFILVAAILLLLVLLPTAKRLGGPVQATGSAPHEAPNES